MEKDKEKSLEEIQKEFNSSQQLRPTTVSLPLSQVGKLFLSRALAGNPQVPGKLVREGKIQDGEFD